MDELVARVASNKDQRAVNVDVSGDGKKQTREDGMGSSDNE